MVREIWRLNGVSSPALPPTLLGLHSTPSARAPALPHSLPGAVVFTDASTGNTLQQDTTGHASAVHVLLWHASGDRLFTGDASGHAAFWVMDSRHVGSVARKHALSGAGISRACWTPVSKGQAAEPAAAAAAAPAFETGPGAGSSGSAAALTALAVVYGDDSGAVKYVDDAGNSKEVLPPLGARIDACEFDAASSRLVIITQSLLLVTLAVGQGMHIEPLTRARLSMNAPSGISAFAWVAPSVLAVASAAEPVIRLLDVASDSVGMLRLTGSTGHPSIQGDARAASLCSVRSRGLLIAGLTTGAVAMWQAGAGGTTSGEDWVSHWAPTQVIAPKAGDQPVHAMAWSADGQAGAALAGPGLHAISAMTSACASSDRLFAVQTGRSSVVALLRDAADRTATPSLNPSAVMAMPDPVRGVACSDTHVALWSSRAVTIWFVDDSGQVAEAGSFTSQCAAAALYSSTVLVAAAGQRAVTAYSAQGLHKTAHSFGVDDGEPIALAANGKFVAAATSEGMVRVLDAASPDLKALHSGRLTKPHGAGRIKRVSALAISADGLAVALLAPGEEQAPSAWVWYAQSDSLVRLPIAGGRVPQGLQFDLAEPRMLAVQCERVDAAEEARAAAAPPAESKWADERAEADVAVPVEVVTAWVPPEADMGPRVADAAPLAQGAEALLALDAPCTWFVSGAALAGAPQGGAAPVLASKLRAFEGMGKVDAAQRKALLEFSYHVAMGAMDAAYDAVRALENPSVWVNMAKMCVRSRRVDVAETALANMGHVRGLRAVRQAAATERDPLVVVAQVALQLGMLSDAAMLYKQCNRWDLLNSLYQAAGKWKEALNIAQRYDRIHLHSTHYKYGQALERAQDVDGAIEQYEAAGVAASEVPRMLVAMKELRRLRDYVNDSADPEIKLWWARYLEINGRASAAQPYYHQAQGTRDLVRMACSEQQFEAAAKIVEESGNPASAYYLARQLEAAGLVRQALGYFEKSGRLNHAVRLAQASGEDGHLMALALRAGEQVKRDAARYFERKGEPQKALQLWAKGGDVPRAVELAVEAGLYEDLANLAANLEAGSMPPEALHRAAQVLLEAGEHAQAVRVLVAAGRGEEAVELLSEHRVKLSEDLVDSLAPPEDPPADWTEGPGAWQERRKGLLLALAEAAERGGEWTAAAKQYTQAGERKLAMRALIRSGDTERIIFFANVSRSREMFVLAANYLQGQDWAGKPEIMKAIVTFYSKAKAHRHLASFFESCASMEMDSFRNYEKAAGALREALKYATRISSEDEQERMTSSLQARASVVDTFVQARAMASQNPDEMVRLCESLITRPGAATHIRLGDVYALLVNYFAHVQDWTRAYSYIRGMQEQGIVLRDFVDLGLVQRVYSGAGVPMDDDDDEGVLDDDDIAVG